MRDEIVRVLRLLAAVLADDGLTAADLAARLDVDPRTIYRDVARLRAAGVEIVGKKRDRLQYGGYMVVGLNPRLKELFVADQAAYASRLRPQVKYTTCARCGREIPATSKLKQYCSREDDLTCFHARMAERMREYLRARRQDKS